MSIYLIKRDDGSLEYPVASIVVRKAFPNVSFPKVMSGYSNPELGVYEFVKTEPPESRFTHDPVEAEPVLENGKYVQKWAAGTPKPQAEIDEAFARIFTRVKSYAGKLIVDKYPDWKQRNMTMRVVTLNGTSPLTDEEQAELVAISASWDEIDAIRAASDLVEQDMVAMGIEAAMAYDFRSSDRWPA